MNLRTFIALLLTLVLSFSASGFQQSPEEDTTANQRDEKITPDEEREARELAARFVKRWEETEDLSPLVKEFFVHDFAERLHHEPQQLYFGEIKEGEKSILESSADLQRHYVAMTDFLRLLIRLQEIHAPILKSEEGQDDTDLKHLLPPGIWDIFRSNPTMRAIMSEELGEKVESQTEGNNQGTDDQANPQVIQNLEELRSLTATLEKAVTLLRAHVKTLPLTIKMSETIANQQSDAQSGESEDNDPLMPRARLLSEDFYGYPKGTRVICLNIMPFHVDLVRVNDRLKVLSLYMQTD
jgi:hypothetical protein